MKSKFLAGAAGCRSEVRTPFRRTARRAAATVAAGSLLLAGAGLVRADDVTSSLTPSVDSVSQIMPLNAGGTKGTTQLGIVQRKEAGGEPGCNFQNQETLKLKFTSSAPAVAAVDEPSTVTFDSCGTGPSLNVTPLSAGDATISATVVYNDTQGKFNLAPATFTVRVAPAAPANTAPTLKIVGAETGASYGKGLVPATTCEITDAEDGSKSLPATPGPITGDYAADGFGSQTATCSYTDAGGLNVAGSVTYNIVDATAPAISYTLNPAEADGLNGWYKRQVTLTWDVLEPDAPLSMTRTGCENVTVSSDQLEQSYTCSAVSAGGSAGPVTASLKKDALAPTVTYAGPTAGPSGTNGWYTSPVTASFTGTDATSGLASATATAVSVGEGAAVRVGNPEFVDLAGNTTAADTVFSDPFKIDMTKPTDILFSSNLGTSFYGYTPAAPTCTATDTVSGLASCVVTGYSTTVGTNKVLTATATDNAGNTITDTQVYNVSPWSATGFYQPVDMNGVWNTVKAGSTVPVKFEVFAGSTEITDPSQLGVAVAKVTCPVNRVTDDIETLVTGLTSLRYDTTGGQFIYNWKTPAGAGTCYKVSMTTPGGVPITANFLTK